MEQAAAVRATREAHPPRRSHSELVYGIEDVPPLPQTLFAALQHMLAMFVAIITPPLIIATPSASLPPTPAISSPCR